MSTCSTGKLTLNTRIRSGTNLKNYKPTFIFHVCLFLVPLFLMGHIALFDMFRGWSWPALPGALAAVGGLGAVLTLGTALMGERALPLIGGKSTLNVVKAGGVSLSPRK